MSIRTEIANAVYDGRLYSLPPLIRSAKPGRDLFVTGEIHEVAFPHQWKTPKGSRHAQMRQTLDRFTQGQWITMAMHPFKKPGNTYLAPIDPPEDDVWDIRCVDPNASIRVLGFFAAKNTFVALTFHYREDLVTGDDWNRERERCKAMWRNVFPAYKPHTGGDIHDYVSRNVRAV